MAAELVNRGRLIQTVYYQHDQMEGYYQPDGRSMRSLFLRSPLQYTRISSRFSHSRFHPILKRRRPHLGVDLAAPLGTPVRAIGNGQVIWAGLKGPNGKMVKIKHDERYTSYYLHLANYADGIEAGTQVEQGQVIGYVGSTGLSTGPHLDFRLTENGQYVNPLKQQNLSAPPLAQAILPKFQLYAKRLIKKLDQVKLAMQQDTTNKAVE